MGELPGSKEENRIDKKGNEVVEEKDERVLEEKENLFVMFDLESTGLGTNSAQIIQIAALPLGNCGQPSFNRCAAHCQNNKTTQKINLQNLNEPAIIDLHIIIS